MRNPELMQYRNQAIMLSKEFHAGNSLAVERTHKAIEKRAELGFEDFLEVIAKEAGCNSWADLIFITKAQKLSRMELAEKLKYALFCGRFSTIEKLLNFEPILANENLGLQIALYDLNAVQYSIKKNSTCATKVVGVRTPILHLAYSKYIHYKPELKNEMMAIAELLVSNGADVNDGYPPEPGSSHKISALYGALGHANNLPLAEWLLENGANPDDEESLYHSTELGHQDGIKLLMRYGVSTHKTNALLRALDFNDQIAIRLLLEYGADPNEVAYSHPSGQPIPEIPALHHAARRWCSGEIASLLIDYGADAKAQWNGYSPYALACIYGNQEFVELLKMKGYAHELSEVESQLTECANGKSLSSKINFDALNNDERKIVTHVILEPSRIDHFKALIESGFDPNQPDEMGLTPIHLAGWAGLPDQVEYLLNFAPDLNYRNFYGGDLLGTIIHGAENRLDSAERDHITCAKLVLEAGAELRQEQIDGTGNENMEVFLESWVEN